MKVRIRIHALFMGTTPKCKQISTICMHALPVKRKYTSRRQLQRIQTSITAEEQTSIGAREAAFASLMLRLHPRMYNGTITIMEEENGNGEEDDGEED